MAAPGTELEELEEAAKLVTILRGHRARHLDDDQVQELVRVFGAAH